MFPDPRADEPRALSKKTILAPGSVAALAPLVLGAWDGQDGPLLQGGGIGQWLRPAPQQSTHTHSRPMPKDPTRGISHPRNAPRPPPTNRLLLAVQEDGGVVRWSSDAMARAPPPSPPPLRFKFMFKVQGIGDQAFALRPLYTRPGPLPTHPICALSSVHCAARVRRVRVFVTGFCVF
jgi:hypothetical protein